MHRKLAVRPGSGDVKALVGFREVIQESPGVDLGPVLAGGTSLDSVQIRAHGSDTGEARAGAPLSANRPLVWHQPHYWGVPGPGIEPFSAIRLGRWKLIYRHLDRGLELCFANRTRPFDGESG